MDENELADRFETHRSRLRAVAERMLGSPGDADDAVQEAWLRLRRVDAADIRNLGGWLTTVVSRVCLDMLRSRESRREELAGHEVPVEGGTDDEPEQEAVLVESVGRALLVVLARLGPAERVAFVLHDLFAVPFEEIAPVVDRSTSTTKKLASRARRKVRGDQEISHSELARQRNVVAAFLTAVRSGDVHAVLAVLAPDVVRTADPATLPEGRAERIRGAQAVGDEIATFGRSARFAELALVDGSVGVVVAPRGRLVLALAVTVEGESVAGYELITDPTRLERLDVAVLGTRPSSTD